MDTGQPANQPWSEQIPGGLPTWGGHDYGSRPTMLTGGQSANQPWSEQIPGGGTPVNLPMPPVMLPGDLPNGPGNIMRPSFLQSFLANLGPSLMGSFATYGPQGEQNFATGLAGGLAGVQQNKQRQFDRAMAIQEQLDKERQQRSDEILRSAQTAEINQRIEMQRRQNEYFAQPSPAAPDQPGAAPGAAVQADGPSGPIAPAPSGPSAGTFMQDAARQRAALGNLTADESALFGSAFSLAMQRQDPTLLGAAVERIVAARKKPEAETPLGTRVPQLNDALTARFQILNPGKPLPPSLTLPADATQKDFDRTDKLLQAQENAKATQAQQATANAIRQQSVGIAQQAAADRQEKQGMKWVSWEDPKTGRQVAGPLSMAQAQGIKNPAEVPTEEIRNITDARGAVTLINKQGSPDAPETMGVLQLAKALEKDGQMGAFTSRYNRLLTQGIGAEPNDDPRIVTLLDKSQLLTTLALKAHFGAGGGRSPQMLQHFTDMANAGKMDGPTFIGGVKAVGNYMEDRAMLPAGTVKSDTSKLSPAGNKYLKGLGVQ